MSISHERHYLPLYTFFNGLESSAACSPICIYYFFFSKRGFKSLLMADDVASKGSKIIFQCTFLGHTPGPFIVSGITLHLNVFFIWIVKNDYFQTSRMVFY